MSRFVVLDTETTGLNRRRDGSPVCERHRIVEVGCVEIVNGTVTGNRFHSFVQPGQRIDVKASLIHGITDDSLKGMPSFRDISTAFFAFIRGAVIVIHNSPFDIAFLNQEFSLLPRQLQPIGVFWVVDTLQIARGLFPNNRNDLDSLCQRFHITAGRRKRHGALLDAELLAKVYLELTK